MDRRTFIVSAAAAVGSVPILKGQAWAQTPSKPSIELPQLPWEQNALDPVISSRTVGIHYGKHHAGYVAALNKLMQAQPFEDQSLEQIIQKSTGKADQQAVFNNAAQIWNHTFYWQSLHPKAGGKPSQDIQNKLNEGFGSFDEFRKAFLAASAGQFGAGWVWLVADQTSKRLSVMKTSNAETPISTGSLVPLAVLDVWEHAYYLDYENRRAEYATAVLDKLFNWNFVEKNLASL
jgi:Fe-Mn family superoxide dismutase